MLEQAKLPKHIAVIMDGNGRWAKQRFLPRAAGHRAGVEAAKLIVKSCIKHQVKHLSLFAFSSENWQRPPQEVNHLMEIFLNGLDKEVMMLHENNVRIRFIGERKRFPESLRKRMTEVEALTFNNAGLTLIVAVDYGGQWDICQAMQKIAAKILTQEIAPTDITEALIAKNLSFSDLPDPDLFIRTSGELRISNFMLWQLAYSELYFTNVLWPDFSHKEFEEALSQFSLRERRYGKSEESL